MIYLDNAATTPLLPSVKNYIISLLDDFGNPSSLHTVGIKSNNLILHSRQFVSKFINANEDEIIFTSGGSASNTLAIKGYQKIHEVDIFYDPTVHKSVLKSIQSLPSHVRKLPIEVDKYGNLDLEHLKEILMLSEKKPFVVVNYANSEIGTIQNVKTIIGLTHEYKGTVYVDATGSIPYIPVDVKELNVDMLGFSGHKLHSLKGCGVLYKKSEVELEPLIYGSQEQGLFSGTGNVLGIASIGKAIEEYDYSYISPRNRDYVWNYIKDKISESYIIGAPITENRLPCNLFICFKGVSGEHLMGLMDINGVYISIGSACNNGERIPSNTLVAIGVDKEDMRSCVRLSFNGNETQEDLDYICLKLKECVTSLRSLCE